MGNPSSITPADDVYVDRGVGGTPEVTVMNDGEPILFMRVSDTGLDDARAFAYSFLAKQRHRLRLLGMFVPLLIA